MPKQINVKLGFEADTSQAKKQIQDLQNSLDGLLKNSVKGSVLGDGINKDISEAEQAILKFKAALNNSLNDNGGLNNYKLAQNMREMGLTAEQLAQHFASLGPNGVKAFSQINAAITSAQKPLAATTGLLDNL